MIQKQTVYLPVEITEEFWKKYDSGEEKPDYEIIDADNGERIDEWVNKQEGYFFTPEQLNEYTQNVIKQALETASEKVKDKLKDDPETLAWVVCAKRTPEIRHFEIDKQSITNTFEEIYQKLKV